MREDVSVFLNCDEFAEEQELSFPQDDGSCVCLMIPVLTKDEATSFRHRHEPELGLMRQSIQVSTADLHTGLQGQSVGNTLLYNHQTWSIQKYEDKHGITTFDLMMQ